MTNKITKIIRITLIVIGLSVFGTLYHQGSIGQNVYSNLGCAANGSESDITERDDIFSSRNIYPSSNMDPRGVQLDLSNNQRILIGSQKSSEMIRAIELALYGIK